MYDRNIRSRLDLVKPNTADVVHQKQHIGPKHDGSNIQEFNNGQPELVRDSYQVDVNGSSWRRHVDQMKNTVLLDDSSEQILLV